jgi:hydroxyacylglutathione hydrolase
MSVKPTLQVSAIPAFTDNYFWLIHDDQHTAVVDPGDAAPVLAALKAKNLQLDAILLTHHHADHAGGVSELINHWNIPVYGPAKEKIAGVTHPLSENDSVNFAQLGLTLHVLDVPGHTAGHIAYVEQNQHWLFCGDTLFAGGCGRLFEGTAEQMTQSLAKFSALADDYKVYCAHEYTASNLRFAVAVDPNNAALSARFQQVQMARERGESTVPSTLGEEKHTNPFLRYDQPAIIQTLRDTGKLSHAEPVASVAAFAALREWKNSFR